MNIPGLSEERADIILAGASIINCLLAQTKSKRIITSGCGLREGLFYDYYAKTNNVPLIAEDILKESTQNVLRLFSVNIEHNRHVAALALSMFDGWHGLHGLGKQYKKLLKTAALLHDIGITINYYSHARHSSYMILNAKIFGLTHAEQMLCAVIAGWHNGIAKRYFKNHAYRALLREKDWDIAGKLALLLALAESLDYSESNTITAIIPDYDSTAATLEIHTAENAAIEMQQINTLEEWFIETFCLPLRTIIKTETPEA